MTKEGEKYQEYVSRRANDIARAIKAIMQGDFDVELSLEEQSDEYEAQIETLVMGFNMMCEELKRLDDIARNELDRAEKYIREQQETIKELSTPIIEIWDDILVLPIVGELNTNRSSDIMESLLQTIADKHSICVILDITGVDTVDSDTAYRLGHIAQSTSLLGTRCILTGLSPVVAQSLAGIGVDFSGIITMRNLKEGLRNCLKYVDRQNR